LRIILQERPTELIWQSMETVRSRNCGNCESNTRCLTRCDNDAARALENWITITKVGFVISQIVRQLSKLQRVAGNRQLARRHAGILRARWRLRFAINATQFALSFKRTSKFTRPSGRRNRRDGVNSAAALSAVISRGAPTIKKAGKKTQRRTRNGPASIRQ